MKRFFLSLVLLCAAGCCYPDKVIMTSIQDSWNAMRPYAEAGIKADTDLSDDARSELLEEAGELSKTIDHEVSHAQ